MERYFDIELKALREKLLLMSSRVESVISDAMKAYLDRNTGLANSVIADDEKIDALEIAIDEDCMKLLALHQPQASDLRFISAVMKINNDLERMADMAVNIAERTLDLVKVPPVPQTLNINKLSTAAQEMLKDSINALVNNDVRLAKEVCLRDTQVDQYYVQIFNDLMKVMQEDKNMIVRAVELIHICKSLERIADHATNICEDVIYMVDGQVIKHRIDGNVAS